jgi:hypothetical protein
MMLWGIFVGRYKPHCRPTRPFFMNENQKKQDSSSEVMVPASRSFQVFIYSLLSVAFAYFNIETWSTFGTAVFWTISGLIGAYFIYVVAMSIREVGYWIKREFYPSFDLVLFSISFLASGLALFLLANTILRMF